MFCWLLIAMTCYICQLRGLILRVFSRWELLLFEVPWLMTKMWTGELQQTLRYVSKVPYCSLAYGTCTAAYSENADTGPRIIVFTRKNFHWYKATRPVLGWSLLMAQLFHYSYHDWSISVLLYIHPISKSSAWLMTSPHSDCYRKLPCDG
jgi:hypothetical protein